MTIVSTRIDRGLYKRDRACFVSKSKT